MDYDDPEQHQQPEPQSNTTGKSNKRVIIIFHCEFSSERGPTLLKFLRNQDRILNENIYPHLFYPELYLLEGGYKLFYENHKAFCEPQTYKPMLHAEHTDDYKHFRAKAKSWEVSRHHMVLKEHLHQLTTEKQHDLNSSHMDVNDSSTIDEEMAMDIPAVSQQAVQRHPVIKMRTKIA